MYKLYNISIINIPTHFFLFFKLEDILMRISSNFFRGCLSKYPQYHKINLGDFSISWIPQN